LSVETKTRKISAGRPEVPFTNHSPALQARLVAFWSAPGSVGRTTTALNLAACASAKARVLFVDLDFVSPSAALLSTSQELPSLSTVLHHHQIAAQVDDAFLREFAPRFASSPNGFRVIAGLSRPDRWPEIDPQLLRALIQDLSSHVDLIVCDLHASAHKLLASNAVARSILAEADSVVALSNANPLSLSRLLREIHEVRALRSDEKSIQAVFNRLGGKVHEPPEVSAFVELTKMSPPMTIRDDHDAFDLLISSASLKAAMRKRSAYKTDMQALTDKVLGL
jgi:MinD-like ATPase involved in chromosome partitioning or flagellar assembly